jgi:hypothetical protein
LAGALPKGLAKWLLAGIRWEKRSLEHLGRGELEKPAPPQLHRLLPTYCHPYPRWGPSWSAVAGRGKRLLGGAGGCWRRSQTALEAAGGAGQRWLHVAAGARRWSAAPAAGLGSGSSAALGGAGGAPASALGTVPSRRSTRLDGGSRTGARRTALEELAWRTGVRRTTAWGERRRGRMPAASRHTAQWRDEARAREGFGN